MQITLEKTNDTIRRCLKLQTLKLNFCFIVTFYLSFYPKNDTWGCEKETSVQDMNDNWMKIHNLAA